MKTSVHHAMLALLATALLALPAIANAQTPAYPTKSIRLVVPSPYGGALDIVARAVAEQSPRHVEWVEERVVCRNTIFGTGEYTFNSPLFARILCTVLLGKIQIETKRMTMPILHFVVDNQPGEQGIRGTSLVQGSVPDGHTILMVYMNYAIGPSLHSKMPYDPLKDFIPIILVADAPHVLVVNPGLPVSSPGELVTYAKANPGKLNFASSGNGTPTHLFGELFRLMTGVQMTHAPYKGNAPALQDLIGGQAQLMFDNLSASLPAIRSGKVRALAVTTTTRSVALPDVPTMADAGFPDFQASSWWGLLAPLGTPPSIVARINAEVAGRLAAPEAKEKLLRLGATAAGGSPDDFARHIQAETAKWAKVVKESGAKVD